MPINNNKFQILFRAVTWSVLAAFLMNVMLPAQMVSAGVIPSAVLQLPATGTMVNTSPAYNPAMMVGMTIHPDNPFQFDFVIDTGDGQLQGEALQTESKRLINYFLTALTVPQDQLWVNLSPHEENRIVADGLSRTEMGRDMLAQDYLLKQLTASLMFPEEELGERFWNRIYKLAHERFGTTDIPTNTFNKVWIVPEYAQVYRHNGSVFVAGRHLKVMLEEDYLSLEGHNAERPGDPNTLDESAKEIIRDIIIPEIEREINEGEHFAKLRQIYNSMILATWYKKNLRESLLSKNYANKNLVKGVDHVDPKTKDDIYSQYLKAFKKGVFNYIKEDIDPVSKTPVPRRYFSGGITNVDEAMITEVGPQNIVEQSTNPKVIVKTNLAAIERTGSDQAMVGTNAVVLEIAETFYEQMERAHVQAVRLESSPAGFGQFFDQEPNAELLHLLQAILDYKASGADPQNRHVGPILDDIDEFVINTFREADIFLEGMDDSRLLLSLMVLYPYKDKKLWSSRLRALAKVSPKAAAFVLALNGLRYRMYADPDMIKYTIPILLPAVLQKINHLTDLGQLEDAKAYYQAAISGLVTAQPSEEFRITLDTILSSLSVSERRILATAHKNFSGQFPINTSIVHYSVFGSGQDFIDELTARKNALTVWGMVSHPDGLKFIHTAWARGSSTIMNVERKYGRPFTNRFFQNYFHLVKKDREVNFDSAEQNVDTTSRQMVTFGRGEYGEFDWPLPTEYSGLSTDQKKKFRHLLGPELYSLIRQEIASSGIKVFTYKDLYFDDDHISRDKTIRFYDRLVYTGWFEPKRTGKTPREFQFTPWIREALSNTQRLPDLQLHMENELRELLGQPIAGGKRDPGVGERLKQRSVQLKQSLQNDSMVTTDDDAMAAEPLAVASQFKNAFVLKYGEPDSVLGLWVNYENDAVSIFDAVQTYGRQHFTEMNSDFRRHKSSALKKWAERLYTNFSYLPSRLEPGAKKKFISEYLRLLIGEPESHWLQVVAAFARKLDQLHPDDIPYASTSFPLTIDYESLGKRVEQLVEARRGQNGLSLAKFLRQDLKIHRNTYNKIISGERIKTKSLSIFLRIANYFGLNLSELLFEQAGEDGSFVIYDIAGLLEHRGMALNFRTARTLLKSKEFPRELQQRYGMIFSENGIEKASIEELLEISEWLGVHPEVMLRRAITVDEVPKAVSETNAYRLKRRVLTTDVFSSIGKRFEMIRELTGQTILGVARKTGVNSTTIRDIEVGRYANANLRSIFKLTDYYGVDLFYILTGEILKGVPLQVIQADGVEERFAFNLSGVRKLTFSQIKQAARKAGIHPNDWRDFEDDSVSNLPTLDTFIKIITTLKVPPGVLLGETQEATRYIKRQRKIRIGKMVKNWIPEGQEYEHIPVDIDPNAVAARLRTLKEIYDLKVSHLRDALGMDIEVINRYLGKGAKKLTAQSALDVRIVAKFADFYGVSLLFLASGYEYDDWDSVYGDINPGIIQRNRNSARRALNVSESYLTGLIQRMTGSKNMEGIMSTSTLKSVMLFSKVTEIPVHVMLSGEAAFDHYFTDIFMDLNGPQRYLKPYEYKLADKVVRGILHHDYSGLMLSATEAKTLQEDIIPKINLLYDQLDTWLGHDVKKSGPIQDPAFEQTLSNLYDSNKGILSADEFNVLYYLYDGGSLAEYLDIIGMVRQKFEAITNSLKERLSRIKRVKEILAELDIDISEEVARGRVSQKPKKTRSDAAMASQSRDEERRQLMAEKKDLKTTLAGLKRKPGLIAYNARRSAEMRIEKIDRQLSRLKSGVDNGQDNAMHSAEIARNQAPGGIDFNPVNMKLSEQGQPIEFSVNPNFSVPAGSIEGLTPVIIQITPVTNFPLLLGLTGDMEEPIAFDTEDSSQEPPQHSHFYSSDRRDRLTMLTLK